VLSDAEAARSLDRIDKTRRVADSDKSVLRRERFFLGQYACYHRLRRGGGGGIVPTLDLANLPRTPQGTVDFAQDFFRREAFLTVSGQLNVGAYCLALTKVYTFGPTFRAENSNTSRHLAEFWMIEPEIAFADLADNAALAEALLKYTFAALLNERQEDLAFFDERIEKGLVAKLEGIVGSEFMHMDYGEAIEVLERAKEKFEFPVKWGVDLQSEHERYLTEKYAKKPVIVMNYPKDIKAFYMRVNDDGTVAAMDVLAPGIGEIIGGNQREERLAVLDARMAERGIDSEHYTPTLPSPASGGKGREGGSAPVARCRTPASASASSAPSPTSPASPTCATRSRSRECSATRGIDAALPSRSRSRLPLVGARLSRSAKGIASTNG
jgi:hypothetical protein